MQEVAKFTLHSYNRLTYVEVLFNYANLSESVDCSDRVLKKFFQCALQCAKQGNIMTFKCFELGFILKFPIFGVLLRAFFSRFRRLRQGDSLYVYHHALAFESDFLLEQRSTLNDECTLRQYQWCF